MNIQTINQTHHKKCTCGLKHSATQPVFGYGNEKSKIVFIGEAPGKQEDEQGKPFVGRSGKLLTQMLETIGASRDEVYITNIVKYRPPENRDPTTQEKQDCLPWLFEELEYIQPNIIVFLGRHAMRTFLPDLTISEVHGKHIKRKISLDIKRKEKFLKCENFICLYHPAVALYNPKMREILQKDFKKIKKYMK